MDVTFVTSQYFLNNETTLDCFEISGIHYFFKKFVNNSAKKFHKYFEVFFQNTNGIPSGPLAVL